MKHNVTSSCPSIEWLKQAALEEDSHTAISVGGMAHDLGILSRPGTSATSALAKLVELTRRNRHLSLEDLAQTLKVDLDELVALEQSGTVTFTAAGNLEKLAEFLQIPLEPLLILAGLNGADSRLEEAAERFSAQTTSATGLSAGEKKALDEFVATLGNA